MERDYDIKAHEYLPQRWVVLKIDYSSETLFKVFAGWGGGYLGEDSWKLNSGIVSAAESNDFWVFQGYSASVYRCRKGNYGMTGYMASVYERWLTQAPGSVFEILPEDYDFMRLNEP